MNPPPNKPPLPAGIIQPKMPANNHPNNIPGLPASPFQQVIQCTRPSGARGPVTLYKLDGKERATDGKQHWYKNRYGTWTRVKTAKVPLYNRFQPSKTGRGGTRKASFAVRVGSGASYSDTKPRVRRAQIKTVRPQIVAAMSHAKRTYTANMLAATTLEGICPTNSATTYATFLGAPVIAGGYNWCHLIGHGGGGTDLASNIVAGSTHCNSEQLQIERIAYQYRNKGVSLSCSVVRHNNSRYLARSITYNVLVNGRRVYTRQMDAFRATKPTFVEVAQVQIALTSAITGALR